MWTVAVPVFVSVTRWVAELPPTAVVVKVSEPWLRVYVGSGSPLTALAADTGATCALRFMNCGAMEASLSITMLEVSARAATSVALPVI